MPTYEYKCASCSHVLEAFQKISEEPLKSCPVCHKETLVRGFGGGQAVFQFKGKGFYITDYKQKSESGSTCCPCGKKESCSSK